MPLSNATAKEIYKENFVEYMLCLALDVGEAMLKNGGEVSRVEDTIERICHAYGAAHVEVFTIISVINAAVRMPDGSYSSQIRRIKSTGTNLGMLEKLNSLSRKICATAPALEEFDSELHKLKNSKFYAPVLIYLSSAAAAGGFACFFGGSLKDGLWAFIIGLMIHFIDRKAPQKVNVMAKTVCSSFIASVIAILAASFGIADSPDYVIIGVIMLLVPGVAFGTAMRDLLYGDLLAGSLKILQAVLTALMIAFGYMISTVLLEAFSVDIATSLPSAPDFTVFFKSQFFVSCIGAAVGSISFALLFKISPKHLLLGTVCGVITYLIYYTIEFYTGGMVFPATFISTIFTALFSEICSRVRKAPTIVFLIPGVVPTVPGGALYRTMRFVLLKEWPSALDTFLVTMQVGLGIAGGILAVSIIYGAISTHIKRKKHEKSKI